MPIGWKFPVMVDQKTGRILVSGHEDNIKESIIILLNTMKGERIMNKRFGSNANKYVFEAFDETVITMFKNDIKQAIEMWESRVRNVNIKAQVDRENSNRIVVDIDYEIEVTGEQDNFQYVFVNN